MSTYLIRRLLLLPLTLFCIILVNFAVLNLAPGDPTTRTEVGGEGASRRAQSSENFNGDDRYLQFREFYGLTLPIFWNSWPSISQEQVDLLLWQVTYRKYSPNSEEEMPFQEHQELRVGLGDRARFIMPKLLHAMEKASDPQISRTAVRFFIRGGMRQAAIGPTLSPQEKRYNRRISRENNFLSSQQLSPNDDNAAVMQKIAALSGWYRDHRESYQLTPAGKELIDIFFTETRFYRYMSRILTLDFGTLRNDSNKTVWSEVTKRFKYSLTLSLLPMIANLFLCLSLGSIMALYHNRWPDSSLNVTCLILYATPIFVVAPLLIEKVALDGHFFWTKISIPFSGFTSPEQIYSHLSSAERLLDILEHIALPLVAILYGNMAAQARLSRTAVLEVLRQDYVRTARAKGVGKMTLLIKHIGRNAAITVVTSVAASLGVVLGGSLIVETLFQIDGFGKFFYDAIVNRDYNVVMFSALAGSFLSLIGYLVADLSYAFLDPRVTLD